MVKIIINGYSGRMGQMLVSSLAATPDMELVAGLDIKIVPNPVVPVFSSLAECPVAADVVLDFSHPDALFTLLPAASAKKMAVVIATTGLTEKHLELIAQYAKEIPLFRSANMSLGINVVKTLIQKAAVVLGEQFDIEIVESHHKMKKDAPSGTALLLFEGLNEVAKPKLTPVYGRSSVGQASPDCQRKKGEVGIHAIRGGTIVGEHEVIFAGNDEVITISHQAFSRQVFASGAIKAAAFLKGKKPGLYSMDDILDSDA